MALAVVLLLGSTTSTAKGEDDQPSRSAALWAKMTLDQKAHGRLFKKFATAIKVVDLGVAVSSGGQGTWVPDDAPELEIPTVSEAIAALYCPADAVFRGTPIDMVSMPIEDGTFIFSDYTIVTGTVYKSRRRLGVNQPITLTRPGGEIKVDGIHARSDVHRYPILEIGQEHIFFVSHVPTTSAYMTQESTGVFSLRRGQATSLDHLPTKSLNLATTGIPIAELFEVMNNILCSGAGR